MTGKALKNVISIGIGGSYLGPEFVFEALRHDPAARAAAEGRRLRFLANVDPVDVARATEGLNPEETLVIVVSKTFTTAESKHEDQTNYWRFSLKCSRVMNVDPLVSAILSLSNGGLVSFPYGRLRCGALQGEPRQEVEEGKPVV